MARLRLLSEGDAQAAEAIAALNWLPERVTVEALAAVRPLYDCLIECHSPNQTIDLVAESLKIGLVVRDALLLQELLRSPLPADILFIPDRLAVLDVYSMARITVKAATPLDAGHCLTEDDLAIERNGAGIGLDMRAQIVGRKLAYSLEADTPIDFGMLQ